MADNTLGLQLGPDEAPSAQTTEGQGKDVQEPPVEAPAQDRGTKGKPYVNPDRVKTGGAQRDKLSDDALAERMQRIREQNEKIKQRRLAVEADEESWRKTQEEEKAKEVRARRMQEDINRAREQTAKRKMDKAQNREWDSEKPASINHAKRNEKLKAAQPAEEATESKPTDPPPTDWALEEPPAPAPAPAPTDSGSDGQWTRGGGPGNGFRGGRGRGERRGRGRARGGRGNAPM